MKLRSLLLFILLLPAAAYCQSIVSPAVGSSEDHRTTIAKIEVTKTNTVVTFDQVLPNKGAWVTLNESIYLQDANGYARYNYVRSEGIPLRPNKLIADRAGQVVQFKVYFQKLKPGTQAIDIIERARSMQDQMSTTRYFNYYNVSLSKSAPVDEHINVNDVVLSPPSAMGHTVRTVTDTATSVTIDPSAMFNNMGPMINNIYTSMLDAQFKLYGKPETTDRLARITKNYYDALIKAGFTADQALKIITSKQLISTDGNMK